MLPSYRNQSIWKANQLGNTCISWVKLSHLRPTSRHLLVQIQQWKHQSNVWNMLKVKTPLLSLYTFSLKNRRCFKTSVCVSGGRKCSFFRKFSVLEVPVLRFALLVYYRRKKCDEKRQAACSWTNIFRAAAFQMS